jgi:peptidoglycan/xylan/chitin deacetylase (PgdA/CDA1 family)
VSGRALILTYHRVDAGAPPLSVHPDLFRRQLDCIQQAGAAVVTVAELAAALRAGQLRNRTVALTFDDGAVSVPRVAALALAERGLRATVFCVADYLGRLGRWPTLPPGVPAFELASAEEIADLAAQGFEIGSHGVAHQPLHRATAAVLHDEVARSKELLHARTGAIVRSFAYPYGLLPSLDERRLVAAHYDAAVAGGNRTVSADDDVTALPRVDMHYFRSLRRLRALINGADGYLYARRVLAQTRRLARADFAGGA